METKAPVNFTVEVKRAQIRAALIFSAVKDIRYYLNGVCLHIGECGDARLVSTDGHRMAIIKLCDQSDATPGEYILPNDALKSIKKSGKFDIALRLTIESQNFRLIDPVDNSILCGAALIDGKFPDYQRVMHLPDAESISPGAFNAAYLADIQKALKELGSKEGLYYLIQNTERGAVVNERFGFMCVVMAIRNEKPEAAPDITQFMPRRKPQAIVETATGGQTFPCDPLQDVTDKREPQAETAPALDEASAPDVVAHCGAAMAAWIDPSGALQKSGLLVIAHIGDKPSAAAAKPEPAPDAEYIAYLASLETQAIAA